MNTALYIQSTAAISPQHTFERAAFLQPVEESNSGKLYVVDADYSKHISPVAIRRMSRMLKISITAAMRCLQEAGGATPDAIITGTGRGSISDMEALVKDMTRMNEQALNPTLFIQSTYNSPNGWIAMQSNCTRYNQTYVHHGSSLELALLDAQLLIMEGEARTALVGCYDEMTEEHFIIKNKIGYWKWPPVSSMQLLQHAETTGSVGGEGAAFFLLSAEAGEAVSKISALRILKNPTAGTVDETIAEVLREKGIGLEDVDFLLTGMSGDVRYQPLYSFLDKVNKQRAGIGAFKHLCGEYDTANGFGLWLADHILRTQHVPFEVLQDDCKAPEKIGRILLVNHYIHGSASVLLLEKV